MAFNGDKVGQSKATEDDKEDDYLNMTFEEPSAATASKETLTERKKRKQREAETRGRPKSKAELAAEGAAKRDVALASNTLDTASKGFKMMAALGYKAGAALGTGRGNGALLEPIGLDMKEGRSGIGADSEKKRKFREEVERKAGEEKRLKVDEGDFRERNRLEREQKRLEGQMIGAKKVCEMLDEEEETGGGEDQDGKETDPERKLKPRPGRPLNTVNVLWRGLIKQREVDERDRRMRYDLQQSLSRRPDYNDPDDDNDDQVALAKKTEEVDFELDQDDEELDAFEALDAGERLRQLVEYLRERWYYCFWCKFKYSDKEMTGCPGLTEDDHD